MDPRSGLPPALAANTQGAPAENAGGLGANTQHEPAASRKPYGIVGDLGRALLRSVAERNLGWQTGRAVEFVLLVALGINAYFSYALFGIAWNAMHGLLDLEAIIDLGMEIAVVSIPISLVCLTAFSGRLVLRKGVPRTSARAMSRDMVTLCAFNITAPLMLALGLVLVMR